MFRSRTKKTVQLQVRRHVPRDKLREFTIEKRHSYFNRRSHAHFIVVGEIQAGHENLAVQIKHLVKKIRVLHSLKISTMTNRRIKLSKRGLQLLCIKRRFLICIEIRAVHDEAIDGRK